MPPVEAMACGTPVVATRSGAVVETVVDGVTGCLVGKGDTDALASAIARLLADDELRAAMGAEARRQALERFSWGAGRGAGDPVLRAARGWLRRGICGTDRKSVV